MPPVARVEPGSSDALDLGQDSTRRATTTPGWLGEVGGPLNDPQLVSRSHKRWWLRNRTAVSTTALLIGVGTSLTVAWIQIQMRSGLQADYIRSTNQLEKKDEMIQALTNDTNDMNQKISNYKLWTLVYLDFWEAANLNSGKGVKDSRLGIDILEGMTVRFKAVIVDISGRSVRLAAPAGQRSCNSAPFALSEDLKNCWGNSSRTIGGEYIFIGQVVYDPDKIVPVDDNKWAVRIIHATCDTPK